MVKIFVLSLKLPEEAFAVVLIDAVVLFIIVVANDDMIEESIKLSFILVFSVTLEIDGGIESYIIVLKLSISFRDLNLLSFFNKLS